MADETRLNLLTRDGSISVVFTPSLPQECYTRLHDLVRDAETPEDMRKCLKMAAAKWGVKVHFN
jgi:hypothetical protein